MATIQFPDGEADPEEETNAVTTVKVWGSRGSIPRSEPNMVKYGGSTSCVEFLSSSGTRIVLDMGSGSYALGQHMIGQYFGGGPEGKARHSGGNILITHTHWDHIQGFPFFVPLFIPGMTWDVYGPRGSAGSIRDSLSGQMQYDYFPVNLNYLGADIRYHDLTEGEFYLGGNRPSAPPSTAASIAGTDGDGDGANDAEDKKDDTDSDAEAESFCQEIGGDVRVTTHYLHHPCLTLGYRLEDTKTNVTMCYITDHEPYDMRMGTEGYTPSNVLSARTADDKHVDFIAGFDLLLHDTQYTAAQYKDKITWGHSTVEYVVDVALAAGVRQLVLFHHDPMRIDEQVEELVQMAKDRIEKRRGEFAATAHANLEVFAAYDKQELILTGSGGGSLRGSLRSSVLSSRRSSAASASAISAPDGPSPSEEFCGNVALIFKLRSAAEPIASLLRVGCDVQIYTDAEEALSVAEKNKPSLYLVQQENGGEMTGVDFCRKIRELSEWGMEVPILVETNDQETLDAIRSDAEGAEVTDFVSKPYSPEYVRTKAHIAMSRSQCRWHKAVLPSDEDIRLETLRDTGLLDSKSEERFDRLTRIASRALDVPVAVVSLVDESRQWFKSCHGLCATETPRDQAFCAHAILQDNVFLIQDATKDDRFADNPLVTGGIVRFYAGIPLAVTGRDRRKHRIGTLCLIDTRPRDLDIEGMRTLEDLGKLVESEIEISLERGKKAAAA
jgi:phosphoribosyl 1,2-cyclic phosphodiesterase/CheY-like chemotaxis protein